MTRYPMRLIPVPRSMIWGGDRLKTKFNKPFSIDSVGESWELTVRPEAQSVIANGIYSGNRLCDILDTGDSFPLLIKFIDAHDDLSVQVHPDDNVTDGNGTPLGKTEMWYIIDADKDSHIIYGLSDGVSVEEFEENVRMGDFSSGMKKVPVKPGDCFFIPAGQVHAICKGILLAEIQQNSDTTYRLYDYDRTDKNGNRRELHVDKALNVIKAFSETDIYNLRYSNGIEDNCLADCDKFKCCKYTATKTTPISITAYDSFISLVFTAGSGEILFNNESYPALAGDTYFIPEGITVNVTGELTFLYAKPN